MPEHKKSFRSDNMNAFETAERLYERLQVMEETYRAILNIVEDVQIERNKSDDTRRALMNILDDVEKERAKAEMSKNQLEVTNKELESFSYSVSHDLRAPLRAISGFSEAIIEDYEPILEEAGKKYLKLIAENANKMGQLIDDLLSFSRLGRQQIIKTEINIASLAWQVWEELMEQAKGRDIKFNIQTMPSVHGDKAMIQQALVNLFSNAIKFTKNEKNPRIEFGYIKDKPEHVFFVGDNGVGFEMQYVDKLFGVFQRLHSVTEFEGTGVGLALVYRIITRHGGRVWAQGEVNKGATFYFTLIRG